MSAVLDPQTDAAPVAVRSAADKQRQWKMVGLFAIVAVLLLVFYLDIKDPTVNYLIKNDVGEKPHQLDAKIVILVALVLTVISLVLAVVNRIPAGAVTLVVALVVGFGFLLGFLVWNYADQTGAIDFAMANPLPGAIKYGVPLVFGALAGCMCERAGVINIAIEGQFLAGAFLLP